jgi:hypothetical protein
MDAVDYLKQDLTELKRRLHNYEAGEDEVGQGTYRARIAQLKGDIKYTEKRIALIVKLDQK